ncbi:MAG TPA: alkaline phosphatase family protein [bacterium]|nr:alkaline phosphatase family protein [bacterium]
MAGVAVVALVAGGCGSGPDKKVVIIGLDGMDWEIIDPLLEEGKMPNLARVISEGCRGDFHSLMPLQKSPAIWTTLATGKGIQKHGIGGFVEGVEQQPLMNSKGWMARSIWDILGEKGYSVGIVGWLITWPALEVNGYLVTDRIAYSPDDGYPVIDDLTYPPELLEEVTPLRQSVTGMELEEIADLMGGDLWREGEDADTWGGVQTIRQICSSDQTIRNIAKHMLETREQPDFLAVYFLGCDRASHRFWGPMRPWTVDTPMGDEIIEAFGSIVPNYYRRMDTLIGEMIDMVDEDSTIIVCSDHGFRGPLRTKDGLQLGLMMHRDTGMIAAVGPGIRSGATVTGASVLDLTPTILALMGEPVGRDMDGFVLTEMLDEQFLEDSPVRYVETYEKESEEAESEEPIESELDDAIKEELRSLGYIE